jgi:hypothetical protein
LVAISKARSSRFCSFTPSVIVEYLTGGFQIPDGEYPQRLSVWGHKPLEVRMLDTIEPIEPG